MTTAAVPVLRSVATEDDAPYAVPPLRLAAPPERRRKPPIAYAAVVVIGVFAIVSGQLLLSIGLSDGAYQIESLQSEKRDLDRTAQSLGEQVARASSPQALAAGAEALGMVSNTDPVYLRLSDGAVLGNPAPASASAGGFTGGQDLVLNAALQGQSPQIPQTPAAPPAVTQPPTVAWQGQLPAPTTR